MICKKNKWSTFCDENHKRWVAPNTLVHELGTISTNLHCDLVWLCVRGGGDWAPGVGRLSVVEGCCVDVEIFISAISDWLRFRGKLKLFEPKFLILL